jgi:hypothetical protein
MTYWDKLGAGREGLTPKRRARGKWPSETSEQMALVAALNRADLTFAAVPNGGRGRTPGRMVSMGVQPGFPDLLVFSPPPKVEGAPGTAVEMKRTGGVPSDVKENQKAWHATLEALGWLVFVGYGFRDAQHKLRELGGYDV